MSQTLKLVSCSGARWSTASRPSNFLSESALFCLKPSWCLIRPYYTRWWGGQGVRRDHPSGVRDCDFHIALSPASIRVSHPRPVFAAKAYRAAGQAASALHAMALLQFYQAKAGAAHSDRPRPMRVKSHCAVPWADANAVVTGGLLGS